MLQKDINTITFKDINELFYRGNLVESETLELKRQLSQDKNGKIENKEFAKDVSAMANAQGGLIILGIDEKAQEICGIEVKMGNQKIEDWIGNVLNDLVDKTISYQLHQIPVNEDESLKVVLLQVAKGVEKPYYVVADKKSLTYIRKGSSVFAAKPEDIREMYKETMLAEVEHKPKVVVKQQAKGKHIQQIAQNYGSIITTAKVQQITEVVYDKDMHITDEQAKQIKDKVEEIVSIHDSAGKFKTSTEKGRFFATTWSGIKNRFNVTKYTLLPKDKFEECMQWLQSQIASRHRPILRKHNNQAWKNVMYSSIYAKSRSDWNMEKENLFDFAFNKLKLKTPISSLKDLSDANLKKLYKMLFST
ncbi:RNA-binding domain-containing protein [Pedobacter xixiisoli]|uniref:ORF6C domain-containing protein n=1 Tax=Pedobacter xixiisoli TaxID=1476464 RepID=A0A286A7G2_9SPHI|nr:RNA-binding domain-containing protein [Pedobacter xixiisoli]SOD17807.1 ORF6C domain-containing protein [Pedobacter xixiisoli]